MTWDKFAGIVVAAVAVAALVMLIMAGSAAI